MLKKIFTALLALFAAVAFAAVDVNKTSQAELESIKGIGPALSQRLLDERKKGDFKDWPDLIERVKGVGSGNAARFSTGGLTVNGAAYSAAPAATPAAGGKAKATATASRPQPAASAGDKPAVNRPTASGGERAAQAQKAGGTTAAVVSAPASTPRATPSASASASAAKAGAKP